ncbi:RNase HII [Hazenella coriacea]|uniref:Ribonuclease HII n=2 Tax=Hazenella coriacea TaxID=1179467 RepID=A0A4R3L198_9BACL|nr:RNase HII [Hazenella coriacea]
MKKTIPQIKAWLQQEVLSTQEIKELQNDSRVGVRKLVQSYLRGQEQKEKELQRLEQMWQYEREARTKGIQIIAGVDEAGRGPLAGPVVASAVILPIDFDVTGINDSKQLSGEQREKLKQKIEQNAISIGVGIVDAEVIDRINILQATYQAMRLAIQQCQPVPDLLLADAVTIPQISIPQKSIIKGDAKSHSIAAASIIAKTTRDEWMRQAAEEYPEYGFEQHMGYGTPTHLEAIRQYGPCPIHRRSFAPVRELMQETLALYTQ